MNHTTLVPRFLYKVRGKTAWCIHFVCALSSLSNMHTEITVNFCLLLKATLHSYTLPVRHISAVLKSEIILL